MQGEDRGIKGVQCVMVVMYGGGYVAGDLLGGITMNGVIWSWNVR